MYHVRLCAPDSAFMPCSVVLRLDARLTAAEADAADAKGTAIGLHRICKDLTAERDAALAKLATMSGGASSAPEGNPYLSGLEHAARRCDWRAAEMRKGVESYVGMKAWDDVARLMTQIGEAEQCAIDIRKIAAGVEADQPSGLRPSAPEVNAAEMVHEWHHKHRRMEMERDAAQAEAARLREAMQAIRDQVGTDENESDWHSTLGVAVIRSVVNRALAAQPAGGKGEA